MLSQYTIRDNDTGEVVSAEETLHDSERTELDANEKLDGKIFWYTEGSMGCDCNRKIMFEKAAGRKTDADFGSYDAPCTYRNKDGVFYRRYTLVNLKLDGIEVLLEDKEVEDWWKK